MESGCLDISHNDIGKKLQCSATSSKKNYHSLWCLMTTTVIMQVRTKHATVWVGIMRCAYVWQPNRRDFFFSKLDCLGFRLQKSNQVVILVISQNRPGMKHVKSFCAHEREAYVYKGLDFCNGACTPNQVRWKIHF